MARAWQPNALILFFASISIFSLGFYLASKSHSALFPPIFILSALFGGAASITSFSLLKNKREIASMPISKISSAVVGSTKLFGKVKSIGKPLITPFTSTPCVYYSIAVSRLVNHTKSPGWVQEFKDEQFTGMLLEDKTGQIRVDLTKAQVEMEDDFSEEFQGFKKMPALLQKFISDKKLPVGKMNSLQIFFNGGRQIKFEESCIPIDDELYVLGQVIDDPTSNDAHNQGRFIAAREPGGLFISDKSEEDILSSVSAFAQITFVGGLIMCVLSALVTITI